MPKTPPPASDEPLTGGPQLDSPYDPPADLSSDEVELVETSPESPESPAEPPRKGRSPAFHIAVGVAVAAVVGGALLAYRSHQNHRQVELRLAKAEELFRLDTAAGYREAAELLGPVVSYDPLEAGSARAFALAMLYADYRDADAEAQAEALLAVPDRARKVPAWASLARCALSLGRREAGNATNAASAAGDLPWAQLLLGRTALLAGNPQAAVDPVAAAAAGDPRLAAALALQGDLARRLKRDETAARASYDAALAASRNHPRAAYGLAKLALAGRLRPADATAALRRVLENRNGTPSPERARAALHLAALSLRSGDRAAAAAALDAALLDPPARSWAERAAEAEAESTGRYRAFEGAPPAISSPSDDDPTEPFPVVAPPPPPPRPAPAAHPAKKPAIAKKKAAPARATKATGKSAAKKPSAKKAAKKKVSG
jgi:hypothetical protein